jgi:hypothetical protein
MGEDVIRLRHDLRQIKQTLGTLIVWMAQSANSPIRVEAAERLLAMLPLDPEQPDESDESPSVPEGGT